MHLLHVAHLEDYRRMMGAQLNVGEGRNGLARAVFFAHHSRLRRGYERGMEDRFHGTYPFNRPEPPGRLRDLRDPTAADDLELRRLWGACATAPSVVVRASGG